MKKMICTCLAVLMFLSLAACAAETAEQRIGRVLTQLFTCPDQEEAEIVGKIEDRLENPPEGTSPDTLQQDLLVLSEEYGEAVKKRFAAADFTESYYERFCGDEYMSSLRFPTACASLDAKITPKSVEVSPADGQSRAYRFTAELQIEQNGETTMFTQEGRVQVDENDRIAYLDIRTYELVDLLLP